MQPPGDPDDTPRPVFNSHNIGILFDYLDAREHAIAPPALVGRAH
jgi:hypothetical protein